MALRKLASIQRVWKIEPIEGADRIELAHVLGWQCVVNKDQFQPEDTAVYFEIDSFLPIRPEFEFMRNSSYAASERLDYRIVICSSVIALFRSFSTFS